MTEIEITKALTEWSERAFTFCNVGMPEFARHILGLINCKQAEIERLEKEVGKEFICFVGDPHKVEHCPYLEQLETAIADAIKEFAERLKEKAVIHEIPFESNEDKYIKLVEVKEIDNLVQERVGD